MSTTTTWIFDLDGTLIDSMTALRELGGAVLAEHFAVSRSDGEEQYRRTSGVPFCEQMELLYPKHPRAHEAVTAFENAKKAFYLETKPFPEVAAVLHALRARGAFLAVSSNNQQELVEQIVQHYALPLDHLCGWKNGEGKGAAHFRAIQSASGATDDAVCFVGDSLHDAATAQAHGLAFAGRTGTFAAEEFHSQFPDVRVVDSLTELLS